MKVCSVKICRQINDYFRIDERNVTSKYQYFFFSEIFGKTCNNKEKEFRKGADTFAPLL